MSNQTCQHVVIVGGGTAGWLTAGMLASTYSSNVSSPEQRRPLRVSLIESPDVATIGVGEGTWPSMRHTLQQIGISETDFLRHCHASLKQGSCFVGWKHGLQDQDTPNTDRYYHPFTAPSISQELDLHYLWQSEMSELPFASVMGAQSQICEQGLAPKQLSTPEYAAVLNYGYHLDAGKFAQLLKQHCIEHLGVNYLCDHVVEICEDEQGYIAALQCREQGKISGDLFIDCSGMQSLLLGQHYQVPLVEQKNVLFNDSALATQVPYATDEQGATPVIAPVTFATAKSCGWVWDIGLATRRGVGLTYSSAHSSDEQAEQILREYLQQAGPQAELRKLSFNPGYRERFWHKNCVAIGMSSGFIEPLEASALAMVELSCNMLCEEFPQNREHMQTLAQRFNQRFEYRWQRVIEFLKLHYAISQRNDSDYWRDHRELDSIPSRLAELLNLWRYQPPSRLDFIQNEEVFPSASYQYVLYGMGYETQLSPVACRTDNAELASRYLQSNQQRMQQLIAGLPVHGEFLNGVAQQSLNRGIV